MARRSKSAVSDYPVDVVENIVDIDVSAEMETSFLEYSYSVIYSSRPPRRPPTASSPCSAASCSRWIRWGCAPTRVT